MQQIYQYIQDYDLKSITYQDVSQIGLESSFQQENYDSKSEILLMRHGISNYNYIHRKVKQIFPDHDKTLLSNVIYTHPSLLDPDLTPVGISQSKEQQQFINKIDLKCIFVSPMKRALQTAYYSLLNHPHKNKFKVVVFPYLTEIMNNSNDLQLNGLEVMQQYQKLFEQQGIKFDYEFLRQLCDQSPIKGIWQLCVSYNKEMIQNFKKCYGEDNFLFKLYEQNKFVAMLETNRDVFNRIKDGRKKLEQLVKEQYGMQGQVLVVCHSRAIMAYTGSGIDESDMILNCFDAKNCEIVGIKN